MVQLAKTMVLLSFVISRLAEIRRVSAIRLAVRKNDGPPPPLVVGKDGQETPERMQAKKCVIAGQDRNKLARDMSVTKPVKNCIKECQPPPFQYFIETFTSDLVHRSGGSSANWCVCSAGGKEMVKFEILDKNKLDLCEKGNTEMMQEECWNMYLKKCGEFEGDSWSPAGEAVKMTAFQYPFMSGDFTTDCSGKCDWDDCNSVSIPSTVDGASDEQKANYRRMIKEFNKVGHGDLPPAGRQKIEGLTDGEILALIDADGNGELSVDELDKYFPDDEGTKIKECVKEIAGDEDGEITCQDFGDFQDCWRKANAPPGANGAASTDNAGSDTDEDPPKWKATEIRCKIGDEIQEDESACGTEEEKAAFLAALKDC